MTQDYDMYMLTAVVFPLMRMLKVSAYCSACPDDTSTSNLYPTKKIHIYIESNMFALGNRII